MSELLQLGLSGLAVGCIYGLVALGFALIYKATEVVNFAQGDLMMLGAFVAWALVTGQGMSPWVGPILAMLILAVFGYGLDRFVMRRNIGQPQFAMVMLTLGLGFVFRSVAGMVWGTETYTIRTPFSGRVFAAGGVVLSLEYLSIIVTTLLVCGGLFLFFRYSTVGIAMQATSQNQLAAAYVGIPVKRLFSMVWALSAGLAAVAGVLLAPVSLIDTNMGLIGLKSIAAAVLGGFGSIPGAVVGGLIVGLIEQYAGVYLDAGFKDIAAWVVLLLVLVVRPQGLFGQVGRKKV